MTIIDGYIADGRAPPSSAASAPGDTQSVYIARYGLPAEALVEGKGPFDMSLSSEGIKAAHELGAFLRENANVKHVFASPFKRALHTAVIVSKDIGLSKVNLEEGITEWQSPELVGGEAPYAPPDLLNLLESFPELSPKYESIAKPQPFETEEDMAKRCGRIVRILCDSVFPSDLLLVSHAPCCATMALALQGLDYAAARQTKVTAWPLGGLTQFRRNARESSWTMEKSASTAHLSGEWQEGKGAWTLPCLR